MALSSQVLFGIAAFSRVMAGLVPAIHVAEPRDRLLVCRPLPLQTIWTSAASLIGRMAGTSPAMTTLTA